MFTNEALKEFDRFSEGIDRWVRHFPDDLQYCSLEALTESNEPRFCIIRAGVPHRQAGQFLDYGKTQLRREFFRCDGLRSRLEALKSNGALPSEHGDLAIGWPQNSFPSQHFQSSCSDYHDWPGYLYEIGGKPSNYVPPEPLVGRGLPPFFDSKDAIQHWIHVKVGDSDGRYQKLLLFIPDFTARISRMIFSDGVLRVWSRFTAGSAVDISVLAADGNKTFRRTKPLGRTQTFRLMPNPTSLRVFITNENSQILDSFAEDQAWSSRERVIFAGADYPADLTEMIRRGETDTVEFKEFIRFDDSKDKKVNDIVKAVISFANTSGGTILIGVADDTEILGVDAYIPNNADKASSFVEDYFLAVRELLKKRLNRIPLIDMRPERLGDKTVLVFRISEGTAKPYVNMQTKETFVRRGANDVRPDPDTDLRAMLALGERASLTWMG